MTWFLIYHYICPILVDNLICTTFRYLPIITEIIFISTIYFFNIVSVVTRGNFRRNIEIYTMLLIWISRNIIEIQGESYATRATYPAYTETVATATNFNFILKHIRAALPLRRSQFYVLLSILIESIQISEGKRCINKVWLYS